MIEIEYTAVTPQYKKKKFKNYIEANKFIYELKQKNYKEIQNKEFEKIYIIHYSDKEGNIII